MEDLFRFILARPAQRADTENTTVPTNPSEDLDKALQSAQDSNDPVEAIKRVAMAHADFSGAVHSLGDLKHGVGLES